jgi:hypothetical protein
MIKSRGPKRRIARIKMGHCNSLLKTNRGIMRKIKTTLKE